MSASADVINPVSDAHVRDGSSANTNFGTATTLEVRTSSTGNNRDSYFQFFIYSFNPQTIVKLRVNAQLSGNGSVPVGVYSTSWGINETQITWNNRPPLGTLLSSTTVTGTALQWYEFDVTSYVKAEKAAGSAMVGLALHATSSSNRVMTAKSRQSATGKPELVSIFDNPPTVSITSPLAGTVFTPPANITITATAADSDGSVTKVEFYQGTTKLGEDTTSPYSFAWNSVPAGSYSLTAVATDNLGVKTTSAAVPITVGAGPTYVSGNIGSSTTWTVAGSPYILTGPTTVQGTGVTLTIQPGVTVKVNVANTQFEYPYNLVIGLGGSLQAVGTPSQPIVFTSNGATPAVADWGGIIFSGAAASRFAYATIAYAGGNANYPGSLYYFGDALLSVENTTIRDSYFEAVVSNAYGAAASLVAVNCQFINTGGGVTKIGPGPVDARLNWWGSSSGPSGAGGGTGLSVGAGVKFEPWLTALPSQPHQFTSAANVNRTFNPAISINTTVNLQTSASGSWTVKVLNGGGSVVRTLSGSGTSGSAVWNGKNDAGVDQPDGTYIYRLESTNAQSQVATPAQGQMILTRTTPLQANNVSVSQPFFSPNADGVKDTTTVSATTAFDGTLFTLNIKNSGGTTVRTTSTVTDSFSYTWDGKNGSGVVQPDGVYTLELLLTNGPTANASSTPTAALDNTVPTVSITSPTAGQVLSNVYQNGSANVSVLGTVDDTTLNNWVLQAWTDGPTISSGTAPVTASVLGVWNTLSVGNGSPTPRLIAWDKAGNVAQTLRNVTVSNFSASQNTVRQISSVTGGSVTYTSKVPFLLREKIFIKNEVGQVVRTIVDADRPAGTYNDSWDGRTASGGLLPDGPYFYVATATAGQSGMTWDQTNEYLGDIGNQWFQQTPGAWDPFNNNRLVYNYTTSAPRVTSIIFTTTDETHIPSVCNPTRICPVLRKYEESGAHALRWAGVDETGVFRASGIKRSIVVSETAYFAKNAVILYGTKPTISNFSVNPAMYGPALGTQSITFDLTTYQSQDASVSVSFFNQGSLSTLRTLTATNQTPGPVAMSWDGRADNGMWVAPGTYTISVTVTDPVGNVVSEQLLTTIQY